MKKGGVIGIGLAILVPGIRAVAIAAAGLAEIPLLTFVPGLVLGSTIVGSLHFILGYLPGSVVGLIGQVLPFPLLLTLVLSLFVAFFAFWVGGYLRHKAAPSEAEAESLAVWQEGICPVCLALSTANQLRPPHS